MMLKFNNVANGWSIIKILYIFTNKKKNNKDLYHVDYSYLDLWTGRENCSHLYCTTEVREEPL